MSADSASNRYRRFSPVLYALNFDIIEYLGSRLRVITQDITDFSDHGIDLLQIFTVGNTQINQSIGIVARFVGDCGDLALGYVMYASFVIAQADVTRLISSTTPVLPTHFNSIALIDLVFP